MLERITEGKVENTKIKQTVRPKSARHFRLNTWEQRITIVETNLAIQFWDAVLKSLVRCSKSGQIYFSQFKF